MSTKAVLIALLIAVVLGIAAIVLLRRPPAATAGDSVAIGSRLLSFTPGEVESVTVSRPDSPREMVEKAPAGKSILGADADWQLRIDPASGAAALTPWPLESAKFQSLLRILSETRADALPAAGADLGKPTRVEVHLTQGRTLILSLAERTLAGLGLIEVQESAGKSPPRRAMAKDQLHNVFTNPGPTAWRERFPAAGIAPDASRIRLTNNARTLLLAKRDGKWRLQEPTVAPADDAAVQRLQAILQRVGILDFLDTGQPTGAAAGTDKPTATVTIEADRRTIETGKSEPKITTDTLTLSIGNAADTAITKLFAFVNKDRIVLLDARSTTEIVTDPAVFCWAHPIRVQPQDVGSIAISLTNPVAGSTAARTIKRSGLRWSQLMPDQSEAPLAPKDQLDAEAVVTFLTGGDAAANSKQAAPKSRAAISLEPPKDYHTIGSIVVASLSGQTLETLELGTVDKTVVIRTGSVYRAYSASECPTLIQAAWASNAAAMQR